MTDAKHNFAAPKSGVILGRLRKRAEFLFVRDGKYKAVGGVVIQAREREPRSEGIRVGFTATKKLGNAVIRNRSKRRLREAARFKLPDLGRPGYDYVFIARNGTHTRRFEALLDDVEKALLSLHL